MTSDDNVVGRVKDKARSVVDGVFGTDDSVADEHPDIEYEEAPKQEVMHDGMVVLSEGQSEEIRKTGDGPAEGDTGGSDTGGT